MFSPSVSLMYIIKPCTSVVVTPTYEMGTNIPIPQRPVIKTLLSTDGILKQAPHMPTSSPTRPTLHCILPLSLKSQRSFTSGSGLCFFHAIGCCYRVCDSVCIGTQG
jgi:hypothetical protein